MELVMYCSKCGKQIEAGKPFCPLCGASVPGYPENVNKADKKVMHFICTFIPGFRTKKAWKIVIASFYYFIALLLILLTGWFGVFFLSIPFVILYVISFFVSLGRGTTPRVISTILAGVVGLTSFVVFVATLPKPDPASSNLTPMQNTDVVTPSPISQQPSATLTLQPSPSPSPTPKPTPTIAPTPTPVIVSDVDYIDFYNNYSKKDIGKWIRIIGKIESITSNSLSIEEGLPTGLTTQIYLRISKEKVDTLNGLNEGDCIVVVGRVDGKMAGMINLEDCYVESSGNVALDAFYRQAEARINNLVKKAIAITPPKLIKEYSQNEVKADNDYKDKLLVVTGTIDSIGKDILDNVYITLSDGSEFSLISVHCTFLNQEQIDLVARLKKGTQITVLGTCKGESITSPMLDDCFIIK